MKTALVFATLYLIACKQPSHYTGKIFTGKSYFELSYDNFSIMADRYSSWNNKPIDTPFVAPFREIERTDTGNIIHTRYFIITEYGLQYYLTVTAKMNLWLNATTMFRLSYEGGQFKHAQLESGECYIETEDTVSLRLTDSLILFIQNQSGVDIRKTKDSLISVSVVRGAAIFVGQFGIATLPPKLQQAGRQFIINKNGSAVHWENVDTSLIKSWRNAKFLLAGDADLNEILQKVGNWYNLRINYPGIVNEIKKSSTPLSVLYTTPLDSVIQIIENAFPVSIKRNSESIFVYQQFYGSGWK
ncbi:MAG: DUF4974 domain-containing protein [Chitinophagaceae bacterium]